MVFIRQQTDEVVVNFALVCGYIAHTLPVQPCFNLDLLFSDLSSLNRPLTPSPSLPANPPHCTPFLQIFTPSLHSTKPTLPP